MVIIIPTAPIQNRNWVSNNINSIAPRNPMQRKNAPIPNKIQNNFLLILLPL